MKLLHISLLFTFLVSASGFASEVSRLNLDNERANPQNNFFLSIESRLPQETYDKLVATFTSIYEKTDFSPDICNSYFNKSELSNFVALPILITPGETFQFEVFGQLFDSKYQYLSNMDQDSLMYGFHYQSAIANKELTNIAMGFGLSVKLDDNVNMKTLFSNGNIPGYGYNNLAVGLEVIF